MQNGALVKEFTKEEVAGWMDGLGSGIPNLIAVLLWVCLVIGFVVFCLGVYTYAKEQKDKSEGNGRGGQSGLIMVFAGAILGSLGVIFLFLVAVVKPS